METVIVKGNEYKIIRLLGHGKGGYSYLAEFSGIQFVIKKIHHEPCDYYQFGNKIEAEHNDYLRLIKAGILVPKMVEIDFKEEIIVKQYIPGKTIFEMIRDDEDVSIYIEQVKEMAKLAKDVGLNIDYFPTNFVPFNGKLYYVDYECNAYMEKWDYDHWGNKYWSKSPEFLEYLKNN